MEFKERLRSGLKRALVRLLVLCLQAIGEPTAWIAGRRKPRALNSVGRILFIALDNPGDVLLATPCLTALKERFPSAALTVLVGEWGRELLESHPAVSKSITYNAPWFKSYVSHLSHRPFRPIRDFFQCLWRLWCSRFDLVIETRGEASHILLAYLSGASLRVGYAVRSVVPWLGPEAVRPLLTHQVPYPWNQWLEWHRADYNLHVVRTLGAIPQDPSLVLPLSPDVHEEIELFLEDHGVRRDELLIGVHPGASREQKRWPRRHFARILDALIERWQARVVVLGSAQEERLAEELAAEMFHQPLLATGQTTLLGAAALVQRCQLVICNDSLITHMASAVKTSVVTLIQSPSNLYAPYHTGGIALTHRLPCMNLGTADGCHCPFPDYRCLQEVTPEEVLVATEEILKHSQSRWSWAHADCD